LAILLAGPSAFADVAPPPVCPGAGEACTGPVPTGTECVSVGDKLTCLQPCATPYQGCCGYGAGQGWCTTSCDAAANLCVPIGGKAYCVSRETCSVDGRACSLATGQTGTCKVVTNCSGITAGRCEITPPTDAGTQDAGASSGSASGGCATALPIRRTVSVVGALSFALAAGLLVRRRR
jgi:hypothetical protein